MFKKVYSVLMLLMMSSLLLNAATDSDELASIAPEEGCYASLRDYLFKKKTMFDDNDVMGGDEEDQEDQGDQESESEEPESAPEKEEEPEVASEDEDSEVAPDTTDDTEVAPETKEEPEVAPEGVLGVDEEGTMSGPAPVISSEEQAAMDAAEQDPNVALILQNFEDEDDFDEGALIGGLLGAGVAAGLAALLAKKLMDKKNKKQAGNVDGQPKVTADDATSRKVGSGEIKRTSVRPVSVSVDDVSKSNLRPAGTAVVVEGKKTSPFLDELKAVQKAGLKPSQIKPAYQRNPPALAPRPANVNDPLAALRARLKDKGTQGLPLEEKKTSELEKAFKDREARAQANRNKIMGSSTPESLSRSVGADDAEQARLKVLAVENAKKKEARNAPKPVRKYVGKYGAKG